MLKKSNYIIIILLFTSFFTDAQVGINTVSPNATLDVVSNTTPTENDGLLVPRVNSFSTTNPGVNQNSMIVFLTTDLTGVNISGTAENYTKGFYYWDNSVPNWIALGSSSISDAWLLEGNTGTDGGTTQFLGTKDDQPLVIKLNADADAANDITFFQNGRINLDNGFKSVIIGDQAGSSLVQRNDTQSYTISGVPTTETLNNSSVLIGDNAGRDLTNRSANVAVGSYALSNANSFGNVAVGINTLRFTTGNNNVAVGRNAARVVGGGERNVAVGQNALNTNVEGDENIAIGSNAMVLANGGDGNIGIGVSALRDAFGDDNIGIGAGALQDAGNDSMGNKVGGNDNIAIGNSALQVTSSGIYNIGIGRGAGISNLEGEYNIFLGFQTALLANNGDNNVVIGRESAFRINDGNLNVFIGDSSGRNEIDSNSNVMIGNGAGAFNGGGDSNVFLGEKAGLGGVFNSGTNDFDEPASGNEVNAENSVYIGKQAGANSTDLRSETLFIENSASGSPLIYGEFDNDILRIGGELQIGTNTTGATTKVYGFPTVDGTNGQVLTTDGSGNVTWQNGGGTSSANNIYTANGTLGADRTVTFGSFDLIFNNRGREFTLSNGNTGGTNSRNQLLFSFGGGALNRFKHAINTQHNSTARAGNSMRFMLHNQGVNGVNDLPTFESLKLDGAETVFNDGGLDVDFRIESDTHTDALNINGANGALQLGAYGAGTITGTATRLLAVDVNGNVIEEAANLSALIDADGDTQIQVEETPDDDTIRFDLLGSERFRMTTNNQLETINTHGNTIIGEDAGAAFVYPAVTPALNDQKMNTFIGFKSGENYTGNGGPANHNFKNTAVGAYSMGNTVSGFGHNTALGHSALRNISGRYNVGVGKDALRNATNADNSVAIGDSSLFSNTTGDDNIALGYWSLYRNTTGSRNIANGFRAIYENISGSNNLAFGSQALGESTQSNNNIAMGNGALLFFNPTTSAPNSVGVTEIKGENMAFGHGTLRNLSSGRFNLAIGVKAGHGIGGGPDSDNNIFIGMFSGRRQASFNSPISGSIFIGNSSGTNSPQNDLLYIENSDSTSPLIGGNFANNRVGINVDMSDPTNNLTHTLTVNGDVEATDYVATNGGLASGYADYVFEDYFGKEATINEDYKFMPLTEAVNFVKENGHLPNVMSYKEFKADNFTLNLATTSLKNLEKIEENFLYIAELKAENNQLKKDNDVLKAKLNEIEAQQAKILKLLKAKNK